MSDTGSFIFGIKVNHNFNNHWLTGFLAVSYMDGSLIVIDMRGPKIILSHETDNKKNKHKRQSIHGRAHDGDGPSSPSSGPDIAKSLRWTINLLDKGKVFFMSHNHHVSSFLFLLKIAR
jgi:hypothetical protein